MQRKSQAVSKTLASLAVVAYLLAGSVASGMWGVSTFWGLALGALLCVPLLILPREVSLWACVVIGYLVNWLVLTLGALPGPTVWALDAMIAIFVLRSVFAAGTAGIGRVPVWLAAVFCVVAASALMSFVSGTSVPVLASGLRYYLRFPLLAVCLIMAPLDMGSIKRYWWLVIAMAAIQVPVAVHQAATVGPGDAAAGTFGPSGTSIAAIFLSAVATTVIFRGPILGKKMSLGDAMIGLMLMIPAVAGSVVAMYVIFPLCVLTTVGVLSTKGALSLRSLTPALLAMAVAMSVGMYFTGTTGYRIDVLQLLSSPEAIVHYESAATDSGTTMGRVDQLRLSWEIVSTGQPGSALLGAGPGSALTNKAGLVFSGPLLSYPGVRYVVTGLALTLLELGILGVAVFVTAYMVVFRAGIRVVRSAGAVDVRLVAAVVMLLALQFIATSPYTNAWHLAGTSLAFWVGVGILAGQDRTNSAVKGTSRGSRLAL